jgi:hypothetical protein
MSRVYKKALKMSLSRKRKGGDISITNVMASDADTVLDFFWYTLLTSFSFLSVTSYMLYFSYRTALVYIYGIPLQIIRMYLRTYISFILTGYFSSLGYYVLCNWSYWIDWFHSISIMYNYKKKKVT